MSDPTRRGPARPATRSGPVGWRRALVAAGVVSALVSGLGGCAGGGEPTAAAPAGTTSAESTPPVAKRSPGGPSWGPVTAPQSPVAPPTDHAGAGVRPLAVSIPSIGVRSSLIPLALIRGSGELAAPEDFGQAGWYEDGPTPGNPGPSVIAGHVDSRDGPAIFFRLRELRPGDAVQVSRSDGTTARFAVTGVERYPKAAFPTQRVHGPTPDRALRLITCGGSFDQAKRSYRDNVVVYAVRTG